MKPLLACVVLVATVGLPLGISASVVASVPINQSTNAKTKLASSSSANRFQQLVEQAWQIVEENYAEPTFNGLDWQRIREEIQSRHYTSSEDAYTAIRAMLGQLNNPATRLLTPQQFAGFEREVLGQAHIGVGLPELLSLDIDETTRQLTIVTPAPNTPVSKAGLLPGDRVVAIDGVSTDGMDLGDAAMRLRGSKESTVQLTIQRDSSIFPIVLTRREIRPVSAVRARLEITWEGRQIGYISLNQFTSSSPQQVKEALERLRIADGLVLDLRNNPGGSVAALQDIAGFFLGETRIGTSVERTGTTEIRSTEAQITNKPLVVLVNRGTASAAEWLAGALRDSERAVIVGMPTFGKGLIHNFLPLADGSVIAVTTGQANTLSGHEILDNGITPNVRVEMSNSPFLEPTITFTSRLDPQYRQAIEQLIMRTERPSPVATTRARTTLLQQTL